MEEGRRTARNRFSPFPVIVAFYEPRKVYLSWSWPWCWWSCVYWLTSLIIITVVVCNKNMGYYSQGGNRFESDLTLLYLSFNGEGRWGATDDFTTSFLQFSLFFTALWDLANSRPVSSLMLSSRLFFDLPCPPPFFTVLCKMVLTRPAACWTGDMFIPLQFASLYEGQEVFVWSYCLLALGTWQRYARRSGRRRNDRRIETIARHNVCLLNILLYLPIVVTWAVS